MTHTDHNKLKSKAAESITLCMSRIVAAAAQIEAIAAHINEYIRQHDNFNKMLSIQNSLTGQMPGILAPARKFIHEGRLMKVWLLTR